MTRTPLDRRPPRPLAALLAGACVAALLGALAPASATAAAASPAAAAESCPAPGGAAITPAADPGSEVVVRGGGWGHSLGMSQYGAQGAALLGCDHEQILRTYYTGSAVTSTDLRTAVMVTLLSQGSGASVTAQSGILTWRDVAGRRTVAQPQGQVWTVARTTAGQVLRDSRGTDRLLVADGSELRAEEFGAVARVQARSGATTVTDLRMRWDYTRFVASDAGLDAWQVVQDDAVGTGVQKYLWGLAEVPASWPQEALRAQAVAGRTYLARRWSDSLGAYVIRATTADQHWTAYAQEEADRAGGGRWRAAVDATPERVVTYGGTLVDALYSSSHGGSSEDPRYVWRQDAPYLRPVDDSRWDLASSNPYRAWAKGFTLAGVASAFGVDRVSSISVPPRGSAARLDGVVLTGTDDGAPFTRRYSGFDVRNRLGLRSPGITAITVRYRGTAVAGDWDGDGDDDLGWFRDGVFTLRADDGTTTTFGFGRSGDVPVVGDWDGAAGDGIGVYRAGQWYLRDAAGPGPGDRVVGLGRAGDVPVTGAWSGGPADGVGVVRGNQWHLRRSATPGGADLVTAFGRAGDRVVVGDWDGDGSSDPGVVRGGLWYLAASAARPVSRPAVAFGPVSGANPIGADWDGPGGDTPGVVIGDQWRWRDDLAGGPATGGLAFAG